MTNIWLLASAENGAGGEGNVVTMQETQQDNQAVTKQDGGTDKTPVTDKQTTKPNPLLQLAPILLIIVVMYLLMFRGPKKKQQEHQKMVASLSKNDRVRTIGGIYGTVLDVREDEIVLKIDESTNTKMRITPSAVATVLKDTKNQ